MKTSHTNQISRLTALRSTWASRCVLAVATVAVAASSALAQSVRVSSAPLRLTIPVGVNSSNFLTLSIPVSGLVNQGVDTVTLAVNGAPGTGNVFTSLSTNNFQSNLTYTATLVITNDSSIVAGDYEMTIDASGAASYRLPIPIQVAYVWSGINFSNAVSTNFASAGNWKGGVVPSSTSKVVFNDGGGQAAATGPTNVIISADTELAGIRFANEATGARAHNIEMQSGATLKISGSGQSFSLLRDNKGLGTPVLVTIAGNGSLVVTNNNADIVNLIDNQQVGTLDLRNLNSFRAEVVRFGMGDYRMYPNYYTNGYTGGNLPSKFLPTVFLAKTNVIKCSWVDPNGYADPGIRDYAITLGNNDASGSTTAFQFRLGLSNAIYADSICWTRRAAGASGGNTYNFVNSGSYALFRGISGGSSRMTIWSQGDASGVSTGTQGSNVRGLLVDFSAGTVDAMVDKFYLTRYDTNNTGRTIQGFMTMGGAYPNSVFNVNDAFIGNQDVVNLSAGPVVSVANGTFGRLTVNSNATFRVNNTLNMGYTISAAGAPNWPENVASELNINSNGVVLAGQIRVGGVTKLSVANNIFMNRGRLTVTNGIGDVTKAVNIFTITNGSQLTVYNVSDTTPSIYVTTLNAGNVGGTCAVNVPVLTNTVWPVTIPLISYVTTAPSIAGLTAGTLPSGVVLQTVVDSNAGAAPNGTINFTFTTNTPKVLLWTGAANGNWDTTSTNWVTLVGATPSRFTDGDSVVFNDSSSVNTITVVGTVTPGQTASAYGIAMTNSTKNYTFAGGSVGGSSSGYKSGTGSLTVNAAFSPGFTVEACTLAGSGSMGTTALLPGTVMTGFSGTINNGLSANNATVTITGTVNGGLALQAGTLNNNGTVSGVFTLADGATLNNTPAGTFNVDTGTPWSVPTNSVLINNGTIYQAGGNPNSSTAGLSVFGTLKGVGVISQPGSENINAVRVTIRAGGQLMIGNSANEVTNTTIAVRLDFIAGSTTTFDVNNTTGTNDTIKLYVQNQSSGKVNYGNGNEVGGTFVINKVAGPDFNAGTTLYLFDIVPLINSPDNVNPARPGITPAPAAGLVWDLNPLEVLTNLTLKVTSQPFLTNDITSTNITFNWPANVVGWRLEVQTNDLSVGINTNWATVGSSWRTNQVVVPIVSTNPTVFYRLANP